MSGSQSSLSTAKNKFKNFFFGRLEIPDVDPVKAAHAAAARQAKAAAKTAESVATKNKDWGAYEDLDRRSKDMLEKIRQYAPSASKLINDLHQAIHTAETHAAGTEYAKALKALGRVDIGKAESVARKAWNDAVKTNRKDQPGFYTAMAAIEQRLSQPGNHLSVDEIAGFRAALKQAQSEALPDPMAPPPPPAGPRQGGEPAAAAPSAADRLLAPIETRLDAAIRTSTTAHGETTALLASCREKIGELAPVDKPDRQLVSDREAMSLRDKYASAELAVDNRDYMAAKALFAAIEAEISVVVRNNANGTESALAALLLWEQEVRDRPELLTALDTFAKGDPAPAPHLKEKAEALWTELGGLAPRGERELTRARDRLLQIKAEQRDMAGRNASWQAYQAKLAEAPAAGAPVADAEAQQAQQAKADVAQMMAQVQARFDALHERVKRDTHGEHSNVADRGLMLRFEQAKTEWHRNTTRAHDLNSLGAEVIVGKLAALDNEIAALLRNNPSGAPGTALGNEIFVGKLELAQADFREATQAATEAAEDRLRVDAAAAAETLDLIEDIAGKAGELGTTEAYRQACGRLNKIARETLAATASQNKMITLAQEAVEAKLAPIQRKLDELGKLSQKAKGQNQVPVAAILETLMGEFDKLRSMRKLEDIVVLRGLQDDIDQLDGDADQAIHAVRGPEEPAKKPKKGASGVAAGAQAANPADGAAPEAQPGASPTFLTFDEMRDLIAGHRVTLGKPDVKDYAVEASAKCRDRLDAFQQGMGSASIRELSDQVRAFRGEVDEVVRLAGLRKTFASSLEEQELGPVIQTLGGEVFIHAPAYRKAKEKQIAELRRRARFDGEAEGTVRAAAQALRGDIGRVVEGDLDGRLVPVALADAETAEITARQDQDKAAKLWEGKKAVIEKRLGNCNANVADKEPLRDMLNSIVDRVKSSGDYQAGLVQLNALGSRLRLLEDNPGGLAITARGKLKTVRDRVGKAIAGFGTAADEFSKKVLADLDRMPEPAGAGNWPAETERRKKAVIAALALTRAQFVAAPLQAPINEMTKDKSTSKERAAAKETGLRIVRRMQVNMTHDYRMRELARNPFHNMQGVISELSCALLDLENNLLTAG